MPEAPDGGHSSDAGPWPELVAAALPDDPPKFARGDALAALPPSAPGAVPAVPVPAAAFAVAAPGCDPIAALAAAALGFDPTAATPVVAAGVAWAETAGVAAAAVLAAAPAPRVTAPPAVTLPGAAVCAEAGTATATAIGNSTAQTRTQVTEPGKPKFIAPVKRPLRLRSSPRAQLTTASACGACSV
jgi:hypothetical protein